MSLVDTATLAALGSPVLEAVTCDGCETTVGPEDAYLCGCSHTVRPFCGHSFLDGACWPVVAAHNDDMGLTTSPAALPTPPPELAGIEWPEDQLREAFGDLAPVVRDADVLSGEPGEIALVDGIPERIAVPVLRLSWWVSGMSIASVGAEYYSPCPETRYN